MNNKDNNNEFPSILKHTFLYFEYLSKSKFVIIESNHKKEDFFPLIPSEKEIL